MQSHSLHHVHSGWGDAAIDGLLAGVMAGLLMAALLLVAGVLAGRSWEDVLRQFDPGLVPMPFVGAVTQLAVSGVYGIIFGCLWQPTHRVWRRLPGWLVGLVYGLLLWQLAITVVAARPNSGGGWLQGILPVPWAAAHLVYGLTLGWLVSRLHNH